MTTLHATLLSQQDEEIPVITFRLKSEDKDENENDNNNDNYDESCVIIDGELNKNSIMEAVIQSQDVCSELGIGTPSECKFMVKRKQQSFISLRWNQFRSMKVHQLTRLQNVDKNYLVVMKEKSRRNVGKVEEMKRKVEEAKLENLREAVQTMSKILDDLTKSDPLGDNMIPVRPLKIRIISYCGTTSLKDSFYVSRVTSNQNQGKDTNIAIPLGDDETILSASETLKYGEHYYLWKMDVGNTDTRSRMYLERSIRCSNETTKDGPHHSCRFRLGLRAYDKDSPGACQPMERQTWVINSNGLRTQLSDMGCNVPWRQNVAMTIGGGIKDQFSPHNDDRRILTSRRNDWNVVVNWFRGGEYTQLVRAEDFPTDGSISNDNRALF